MKLIISRKGMDTGSGGCFSPYDHLTGKYIWFPIPEKVPYYANKIRYSDIEIKDGYLDPIDGKNLQELFLNVKRNDRMKLKKDEFCSIHDRDLFAHFDPMLGSPTWMEERESIRIGKGFGQSNAASQLDKQGVKKGDVFLFFGGFKSIHNQFSGHYIFGWLKIKDKIENYVDAKRVMDELNLIHHPHMTKEAFERKDKNYIFTPEQWLFEDLQIPGCGYFSTLNDSLLLSKSKQTYKSEWKLPSFFYKNLSQVHHKTWEQSPEGFCTVKTGIGQEFIAQLPEQGEEWLRDLFKKNKRNIHI